MAQVAHRPPQQRQGRLRPPFSIPGRPVTLRDNARSGQAWPTLNQEPMICSPHYLCLALAAALLPLSSMPAAAQAGTVYRCPGPPVLYTDALTLAEVRERGCRSIEGAPISVVQSPRPRPAAGAGSAPAGNTPATAPAARASEGRVDPAAQRQRDSDARRILEAELAREEDKLASARREYNNGEPERRGDERNFQKYQERTSQLKAGIARSESDVAAIKRELAKIAP